MSQSDEYLFRSSRVETTPENTTPTPQPTQPRARPELRLLLNAEEVSKAIIYWIQEGMPEPDTNGRVEFERADRPKVPTIDVCATYKHEGEYF